MDIPALIFVATATMLVMASSIIIIVLMYQRNMLRKDQEIQIIEQQKQLQLFDASAKAEEREKERIARNLHDEINPMLIILKQNLQRHKFDMVKNKFSPDHFESDYILIDKITEGIRASSYELVPSYLAKFGLIKSLEDYVRSLNTDANLKSGFKVNNSFYEEFPLPKADQLNVYRMCLELTNNTLKHSYCTAFDFTIHVLEKNLSMEIHHNGKGVDNEEIEEFMQNSKGLGLKSLQARALLLNAQIDYTKELDKAVIKLIIPFKL